MIILSLGNVGSGKTATIVKEMQIRMSKIPTYSNIKTKIKNVKEIKPEMIVKKEVTGYKRDGSEINKFSLNEDFWKKVPKPCNVVIDEAHSLVSARKSMSKVNQIMTDWIALLRRVLGESDISGGDLVMITQLERRIDVIVREMAHQVRYHIAHFTKSCSKCGLYWRENSDTPEQIKMCPACANHIIKKSNFKIEVFHFRNIDFYKAWKDDGIKSYHRRYYVTDVEKYFPLYDTLQWDNLLSSLY